MALELDSDCNAMLPRRFIYLPLVILATLFYTVYLVFFDPLRKYPGPVLARISNLWRVYHFWKGDLPEVMLKLHQKYGPVIRCGPNDLDFDSTAAMKSIYKAGRSMPKTDFYKGFTTFKANLFGTQDESLHALRRRQMAHAFSAASLKDMEYIFDRHLTTLRQRLDELTVSQQTFNLKELIEYYTFDVLGELAFSTQFESQKQADPDQMPPITEHVFLACIVGILSDLLPYSMKLISMLPVPWFRHLTNSRKQLRDKTVECVDIEMSNTGGNKTLLTSLINAVDPDTGAKLSKAEICSEAFGFLIAGAHTSSSTLTMLFFNILHRPEILHTLVAELDKELPLKSECADNYPITQLETTLPYAMACIRENFRFSAVFTMFLPRVVTAPEGIDIEGDHVPYRTNVAITNHCLHHNSKIWGKDHAEFSPDRWLHEDASEYVGILMPFGMGHRSCIGRNIAMINIMKVFATLLRMYEFEVIDKDEVLKVDHVGIAEKKGPILCKVRKRE
ncbi:cytochrome P450 [Xylogone sp. PMI_703]|nr:cytochrome P450 [Xylogone sp. PMI_703]